MTDVGTAHVAGGLEEVAPEPSVVTIGNFDGVHRGHRTLLRRTVEAARARGLRSIAVTFDPHPAAVVRPGSEPTPLQPLDARIAELAATGVDLVLVLPFTRELSTLSPDAFVARVLAEGLRARRVVVGTNWRFGHRAAGDVVTLVEAGEAHGFEVEAVGLLEVDGVAISSSAIRTHLLEGDVAWAVRALGRPHTVAGEVVAGDGRGRTIGVPTANLALDAPVVVPAAGVYAGHAFVAGDTLPCVTNVGVRPTFDQHGPAVVETHLIDVDRDLYGVRLTVGFEHRLRAEQRFDAVEALVAQISHDVARARSLLGVAGGPGDRAR